MKSVNRWLIIFGSIVGVLVIVAVTLVLTMQNNHPLLAENTPEGVVQRYILALKDGDSQTAYTYLSDTAQTSMPYNTWKPIPPQNGNPTWQATIGKATVHGTSATVAVNVDRFYPSNGLNSSISSQTFVFQLVKQSDGWKINQPDYLWGLFY
jgi:hypothetical protein